MNSFVEELIFWGTWLIIPLSVDILTGLLSSLIVLKSYIFKKKKSDMEFKPFVTILVPVYNSEETLEKCIESIVNQNYPISNMQVFLIDNGSLDNSYDIYCNIQEKYPMLRVWWLDSSQGKAKALNKGIYLAEGKYIINIDSDGILDENAVYNMVYKFENNIDIVAMTGVVLTDYKLIKNTKGFIKKIIKKCELFEYCEAFLVGRGLQSETNTMFTLAGACSAFRKDAVFKTQLYNGETLGEDTHMTSQIREFLDGRVVLCEDAFFFVEPIEKLDNLYIQRQRWQRGQIEVSTLFWDKARTKKFVNVLKFNMIVDHTLVFPRLIWMFAMIYLMFIDYPMKLIVGANLIIYLAYVLNSLIFYIVGGLYLKNQKETKKYMFRNIFIIFLLPMYRMILFFIRASGIINSIEKRTVWNTKTFTEEKRILRKSMNEKFRFFFRIKSWVNNEN